MTKVMFLDEESKSEGGTVCVICLNPVRFQVDENGAPVLKTSLKKSNSVRSKLLNLLGLRHQQIKVPHPSPDN
jgi:hypothetical protein